MRDWKAGDMARVGVVEIRAHRKTTIVLQKEGNALDENVLEPNVWF